LSWFYRHKLGYSTGWRRKEVRKKFTDPKTKKQFEVVVRADNNGEVYEAFDVFPR